MLKNKPKIKKPSELISLTKFFNKLIYANLAFGFGITILIFSCIFGENAYGGFDQYLGNLILSILVTVGSLAFSITLTCLMNFKGKKPYRSDLMLAASIITNIIPYLGTIMDFVFKSKEISAFTIDQQKTNPEFKKPKTKVPSAYTILFVLIIIVILIVWMVYIVTGGIYHNDDTSPTGSSIYPVPGILDIFSAPITGFIDAAGLVIFLLIMGGFLQVVNETKALEAGVGSLVKKMKNKEIWLIPILMLLFSIGGTTYGMCEETLPFYLIIIPIMLAGGFDVFTGLLIILFGAGMGVAGSILNPFVINTSVDAIGQVQSNIVTISDGIVWRVVSYLVIVSTSIGFVSWYAKRVKSNPARSIVYEMKDDHLKSFSFDQNTVPVMTTKRKTTLIIFALTFLVMIFSVISWQDITGWDGFVQLNSWLEAYFPFISSNGPIGTWYLVEMSFLFFIAAVIIGAMHWNGEENFINSFFVGCKDFIGVALIISLARGLSVILINSGINEIIISGLGGMLASLNAQVAVLLLFFVFILLSFLIPSTSGFASAVMPSVGPALVSSGALTASAGITTFSFASGLINVISPTSGPFIAALSLSKVPLVKYYKGAWKLIAIITVVMLVLLLLGTLFPVISNGAIF